MAASWPTGRLRANFPMAFGMMASGPMASAGPVLAVIFRSPPRLAMIDAASGVITADRETCGDADDVFFDIRRRHLMVSCSEGAVDLFDRTDAGLQHLARIRTRPGARTALFVPQRDRLYVAARAGPAGEAAILVFRPVP
jgi:hypothetical protein